ncbi:HAMP domain-containing sensor histidine kinase [Kribbella sp. NPDC023855]|uniref:sensor histidine kinase n=1 Tax=Kribbella sp. NPDC023855 TaxID=3154698 RepID=UPI0033E5F54A
MTVVAGLLSAVLAGGFAYWIRHEIYTERYRLSDTEARETVLAMLLTVQQERSLRWPVPRDTRGTYPLYQIVDSTGWIASTSEVLRGYTYTKPLVPAPARGRQRASEFETRVVLGRYDGSRDLCGSDAAALPETACERDRRLAGQDLKVRAIVRPMRDIYPSNTIAADRTVAISVLVSPLEAEDAVASVDRVLRPALPAAVLLIMLGAYFGTRLALRPVERIRARAAEIGERNLHERVPVPPTRDVVARLALTLNETLDRLDKAADRQRGFIADAAHELRSPIASLRATLEVAGEHPDRADWTAVNDAAVEDTRRLQELADDLLLVARLDAGEEAARTRVDLAELVRRHVGRRFGDDGPRLAVEAVESAAVLGDARQLDRLLRNLVDNAVRHAKLVVTVRVEVEDDQVLVHVDDDGAGIPVPAREQVFERFIRLDEARSRDAGGVGLGLAIAHEIAVRHGGSLRIADSPEGGARLTLTLRTAELQGKG